MTMWGGRFDHPPADAARAFTRSFPWDRRMYREDVVASQAHAAMLGAQGIISPDDARALVRALAQLLEELDGTGGPADEGDEDIFSYVERVLTQRLGDAGKRLHTARSRNDQVATDFRLYSKGLCLRLGRSILDLVDTLLERAEPEAETLMPGFTHLQAAQPVTLGHYLMSIVEMLRRDVTGVLSAFASADVCPLGAGALAGVPFPIDRERVANDLKFSEVTRNSIDSVADRDYVMDLLHACQRLMLHLSRWCEDLVIWSSPGYALVEFDDRFATGSSMLPQKKNPDVAELVRGKAGSVLGLSAGLAATVKAVPLSYGLDLQEDKQALFAAEDHVLPALRALQGAASTLMFDRARMAAAAQAGYPTATEVADFLAERGEPFRSAHKIAGRLVRHAISKGCRLDELADADLAEVDPRLTPEVRGRLSVESAVVRRSSIGGTGPDRVRREIEHARAWSKLQRGRFDELEATGLPESLHARGG